MPETTNETWVEETQRMIDYVANETVKITTEFVKNKLFTYDEMREELDIVGERAIKKQASIISEERKRAQLEIVQGMYNVAKEAKTLLEGESQRLAENWMIQVVFYAQSLGLNIKE